MNKSESTEVIKAHEFFIDEMKKKYGNNWQRYPEVLAAMLNGYFALKSTNKPSK